MDKQYFTNQTKAAQTVANRASNRNKQAATVSLLQLSKSSIFKMLSLLFVSALLLISMSNNPVYAADNFEEPIKINGEMIALGDIDANYFQISPDGKYVVYRADQDTDGVFEIYSCPLVVATQLS